LNEENVRYTVGEITDFKYEAKSPPVFTITFLIDKKKTNEYYSIVDELAMTINITNTKNEYYGKKF
jgi:hypothetical protein